MISFRLGDAHDAAGRFGEWLDEVGSSVLVRALGGRHYQLATRKPGPPQ